MGGSPKRIGIRLQERDRLLDHLSGIQEYYRPLRAIDPSEWRDVAEMLKEENLLEMAKKK